MFYNTLFVETFANFANGGLVRQSLSCEIFSKSPFAKVYLTKSFQNDRSRKLISQKFISRQFLLRKFISQKFISRQFLLRKFISQKFISRQFLLQKFISQKFILRKFILRKFILRKFLRIKY